MLEQELVLVLVSGVGGDVLERDGQHGERHARPVERAPRPRGGGGGWRERRGVGPLVALARWPVAAAVVGRRVTAGSVAGEFLVVARYHSACPSAERETFTKNEKRNTKHKCSTLLKRQGRQRHLDEQHSDNSALLKRTTDG